MGLELNFKNVCTMIKKQGAEDAELIDAVDKLFGLALVCSPMVVGSITAALLPALAAKNELTKIGKSVFEKFTKPKDEDYLVRFETMQAAYGLLVFTAFFDALDSSLSKSLRKEIKLLDTEKAFVIKDAVATELPTAPFMNHTFAFPHPTETLAEQTERMNSLWQKMGAGFVEFIHTFDFWAKADQDKRGKLLEGLEDIDKEAAARFEAQYFDLARQFESFAIWANLQAHKNTKALIGQLSEYAKGYAALAATSAQEIDVGFKKLHKAVMTLPELLRKEQAVEIASSLNIHYQARINDLILDDKQQDKTKPCLVFPKACDAFIPQAFKVLRIESKQQPLENDATWQGLERRDDLNAFLLSYLSSPYSTETPLLVLGHPGSGKSLLTTILSAQLMSTQFTIIRVPLREVNAEADIVTQVEEAIRRITGLSIESWIKLSALFVDYPPLVILDGYDELLQASGQVFASYIKDAQRLQQREAEQGRPLRIIITSRVTLIDKAAIPGGSTVVRLLEFDQRQRDQWMGIWNDANVGYFTESGIEPFALPSEKDTGAEKMLNLAEQPLLLLMLALYDSQGNQLRISQGLDKTELYNNLLRRFVTREREKEKGFNDVKTVEQDKKLAIEMQRLGVVALGMFNRRKVHILSAELEKDLTFFKLKCKVSDNEGRALSQADLLLGSFFFVHESKSQLCSGAGQGHEEMAAFEFLHNTFGEFLTADFALRHVVTQVQSLRHQESAEIGLSAVEKILNTADGLELGWFASLVYTPLFTRPVIMEMIREWLPHVLKEKGLSQADFIESLEKILLTQLKRLLNQRDMPTIMQNNTLGDNLIPFDAHPLVGHIAIYSLNLLLLRIIASETPLVFDECSIVSHEDGTRPWDRLVHIWRSWFSADNLIGLTAVMLAERGGTKIEIKATNDFKAREFKNKIYGHHNIARSLGDDFSVGITGLYLFDSYRESLNEFDSLGQRLSVDTNDTCLTFAVARLRALAKNLPDDVGEFADYGHNTLVNAFNSGKKGHIANLCYIIDCAIRQGGGSNLWCESDFHLFRRLLHPRVVVEISFMDPRSSRTLFSLAKHVGNFNWLDEFPRSLIFISDWKARSILLNALSAEQFIEWLLLLQDISNTVHLDWQHVSEELASAIFQPHRWNIHNENFAESALTYLQILSGLEGLDNFGLDTGGGIVRKISGHLFHPQQLLALSERSPHVLLGCLELLWGMKDRRYFEPLLEKGVMQTLFDRLFKTSVLFELNEYNPVRAWDYIQVLQKMSDRYHIEIPESLIRRDFDIWFQPGRLLERAEQNIYSLGFWLVYARLTKSQYLTQTLSEVISSGLKKSINFKRLLTTLPISSLADLRWLAKKTQNKEIDHFVSEVMGEVIE